MHKAQIVWFTFKLHENIHKHKQKCKSTDCVVYIQVHMKTYTNINMNKTGISTACVVWTGNFAITAS